MQQVNPVEIDAFWTSENQFKRYDDTKKKDSSDEPTDMKVFLVDFLKRKYPHEAYEYSYTIHDAFSKYSHEFIKFFEAILKGEVTILAYYFSFKENF